MLHWVNSARNLISKEIKTPFALDYSKRFRMWSKGFLSESYVIYSLDRNDIKDYLSDYNRFVKSSRINGKYAVVLNNKLLFRDVMGGFCPNFPEIYGLIQNGDILFLRQREGAAGSPDLEDYLQKDGGLVFKPVAGGGGAGVIVVQNRSGKLLMNETETTLDAVRQVIRGLNNYMMVEYVKQAIYSSGIFHKTTNTIRVLTMWDLKINRPFVAAAVHRFGTEKTSVDNWTQGGLSAKVELETGKLGAGVTYPSSGELVWHDFHPATGSRIKGVQIPYWPSAKEKIIALAGAFPHIPYIGWDIVMQEGDFKIIEGNNYTDVNLLQVHGPLLRDRRVRRFYKEYAVI